MSFDTRPEFLRREPHHALVRAQPPTYTVPRVKTSTELYQVKSVAGYARRSRIA